MMFGWNYYDNRIFARQNSGKLFDKIKKHLFTEDNINSNHKLAIIPEQGLGEQILFSSMYSDLIKNNSKIVFFIDPRFKDIFKRSFGNYQYIDKNDLEKIDETILKDFKFLYAGNLGRYYRNKIKNFSGKSFYKINADKVNKYKSILSNLSL